MLALLITVGLVAAAPAETRLDDPYALVAVSAAGTSVEHIGAEEEIPEWFIRLVESRGEPDCELVGNPNTFDYVVRLTTWPGLVPDRIVYIDASAPFGGDGSSWQNAYQSLHDALNNESFDAELVDIRIATGWYRADRIGGVDTLNPDLTYTLPGITVTDGVPRGVMRIAGGFAGRNARNPDARDLELYPTVFTGDLLNNDTPEYENYEDNTKVMFEPGLTELNGIEIEHARIAVNGLRWMTDCTVRWCFASGSDLPLVREDRSPVVAREARIVGNTFHNNRAEAYGGAMAIKGFRVVVANSRFLRNTAPAGGAIASNFSQISIRLFVQNSYFAANVADGDLGGVGGAVFSLGLAQFAHCTFVGNVAVEGGGSGVLGGNGYPNFRNCIFDQNFSYDGSGPEAVLFFPQMSYVDTRLGAVVFGETRAYVEDPIFSPSGIRLNIESDPGFADLLGPDGQLGTLDDHPALGFDSPAIGRSVSPPPFASIDNLALFDIADLDGDCDRTEPLPVDMLGNPRAIESVPGEGVDGYAADAGCIEFVPHADAAPGQPWNYVSPMITDFSTEPIRVHVREDAPSGGDGSSWESAFSNLCDALLLAERRAGPVEIWVAGGTYRASCERSGLRAFRIIETVTLLGGFAGHETSVDERDWVANETILSGDVLGNDDLDDPSTLTDNAHHVVLSVGQRGGGVVDGFTIRDGLPEPQYLFGPGLYWIAGVGLGGRFTSGLVFHAYGDLTIRNCTLGQVPGADAASIAIAGNAANLQILDSTVVVVDAPVQPDGFIVHDSVGTLFHSLEGFGQVLIRGCEITLARSNLFRPSGWYAGSIEVDQSVVRARSDSGLLRSLGQLGSIRGYQPVTLKDSVFVGSALMGAHDIRIRNSTFLSNLSIPSSSLSPSLQRMVSISNSVFCRGFTMSNQGLKVVSGNTFSTIVDPAQYEPFGEHNAAFDFANHADAFFVDFLGPDGIPYTGDENYRLAPGSPAINTGLNEFVTSEFDLDGNPRIIGSVVDRGAYEFTGTCPGDVNGDGVINLTDLNMVLRNFGADSPFGDANGDGVVDKADLNIVLAGFGQSCTR